MHLKVFTFLIFAKSKNMEIIKRGKKIALITFNCFVSGTKKKKRRKLQAFWLPMFVLFTFSREHLQRII